MRTLAFALIIFFLLIPAVKGQEDNETGDSRVPFALSVRSMNFFRNNEYFNQITGSDFRLSGELPANVDKSLWIEGYTLPGFFFRPEVVYNPTEKISLRAGGHMLKYWGDGGFAEIRPVFSTSISLSESTTLILGSLAGPASHKMSDPHFNSERLYKDYAEEGLQITTNTSRLFNDAWISWENFIYIGDEEREIFTFGESFRYTLKVSEYMDIEIPLQLQFKHFGGQVSNYPERVTTFFNAAGGLRLNADISGGKFGKAGLEYTHFLNSVIPPRDTYILNEGNASWWRLHYNLKRFCLGAGYWLADDFYAPNGNGIYASVFVFDSDYIIHKREIINASASIRFLPEDYLELFFGMETFYDVCGKKLDYALTLHLDFDRIFRIRNSDM